MRLLTILSLTLIVACGTPPVDEAGVRQFGLGDPIEDPELMRRLVEHESPHVRRAAQLKLQVDSDNLIDLERLADSLRARPAEPVETVIASANALLATERDKLVDLKAHLDAQAGDERGLPDLRTSLGKLLGTDVYSGILEDATTLLGENGAALAAGRLPEPLPRHNAITVTKAAQIFLAMAAFARPLAAMPELVNGVELLYPAALPASVPTELAKLPALAGDHSLLVPNAGYIFGGAAIDGRVRGFDCSAYLSMATDSSVRLSTGVMEYAWRELRGEPFPDDPTGAIREEMREKYGLAAAEAEYEAVDATLETLQPGDLVVWRYPRSYPTRSGHVAMFAARDVPNGAEGEFLGLEATRADDKTREGVLVRGFALEPDDAFTFVLRRRVR